MLSKLQDVATANGGNLDPDWGGSMPPSSDGQQQRKEPASDTRKCCSSNGEPGGWDERRNGGTAPAGKERCVLEDFTQCSKSHLWKLMMSFYDRKGVESWSQVGLTRTLPTWVYSVAVITRPVFVQELARGNYKSNLSTAVRRMYVSWSFSLSAVLPVPAVCCRFLGILLYSRSTSYQV